MQTPHQADSAVQSVAEAQIIERLGEQIGVRLTQSPPAIAVGPGASVLVDAATPDRAVIVEAFARQGALKPGQHKKVATDLLKFALLRQQTAADDPPSDTTVPAGFRAIIAFADEKARGSVTGWRRAAADAFGVELMVVQLDDDTVAAIRDAQARQAMTNVPADEVADDIAGTAD